MTELLNYNSAHSLLVLGFIKDLLLIDAFMSSSQVVGKRERAAGIEKDCFKTQVGGLALLQYFLPFYNNKAGIRALHLHGAKY